MYAVPEKFTHNMTIRRFNALIFQERLNLKFIKKEAIKNLDKIPGKLTHA